MASISAARRGLRAATDIARHLRDTEAAFKTADLKLRIADLVDALANAKLSLAEVQEELVEKDAEIQRLEEALKLKAEVARYQGRLLREERQWPSNWGPILLVVL